MLCAQCNIFCYVQEPITSVDIEFGDEKENQEDEENEVETSKQQSGEEFDDSSGSSEEPGGLVGLITNLSGVNVNTI